MHKCWKRVDKLFVKYIRITLIKTHSTFSQYFFRLNVYILQLRCELKWRSVIKYSRIQPFASINISNKFYSRAVELWLSRLVRKLANRILNNAFWMYDTNYDFCSVRMLRYSIIFRCFLRRVFCFEIFPLQSQFNTLHYFKTAMTGAQLSYYGGNDTILISPHTLLSSHGVDAMAPSGDNFLVKQYLHYCNTSDRNIYALEKNRLTTNRLVCTLRLWNIATDDHEPENVSWLVVVVVVVSRVVQ